MQQSSDWPIRAATYIYSYTPTATSPRAFISQRRGDGLQASEIRDIVTRTYFPDVQIEVLVGAVPVRVLVQTHHAPAPVQRLDALRPRVPLHGLLVSANLPVPDDHIGFPKMRTGHQDARLGVASRLHEG